MHFRSLVMACAVLPFIAATVFGQSRDYRVERLVLDDGNGNTVTIQTPAGPITGGTLTLPDPGGSGQILITNPSGGSQSVSGDMLPGADDTYDLGSGASRWQDIFSSGNVQIGGQARYVETGGGTDYVGFQAPAAVTANQVWTLPAADGTSGQALVTDGSGILSWATAGGGTVTTNATLTGDGSGGSPLSINLAQGNTWTGLQQFNAAFTILGNGRFALTNNDNNARDIRWQEPSGSGSQYVGLRAPAVPRNSNYVFPDTIGAPGDVLAVATRNAFLDSATLEWVTPTGGGGTVTTDVTLAGDGSGGSPLSINLANANTWTAAQTYASISDFQGPIGNTVGDLQIGDAFYVNSGGSTNMRFDEASIARNSGSDETIAINNPGSGAISVLINGAAAVGNSRLVINDGHLTSQQTTAPAVEPAGAHVASASLSNATDVAGFIEFEAGGTPAPGAQVTVTFDAAYDTAPIVGLTPANDNAADAVSGVGTFVTSTPNGFTVNFAIVPLGSPTFQYFYQVIETQ